MTENKQKQDADKKKQEAYNSMQDIQARILLNGSMVTAANSLKNLYGEAGAKIADQYMSGAEAYAMKNEMFESQKAEAEQLGVAYEQQMLTNGAFSLHTAKMAKAAKGVLNFGNLAKITEQFGLKTDFKVPDEFKNWTEKDLEAKLKNAGGIDKLDEKSIHAMNCYGILETAYTKGSALSLMNQSYTNEMDGMTKEFFESYKKKESKAEGDK